MSLKICKVVESPNWFWDNLVIVITFHFFYFFYFFSGVCMALVEHQIQIKQDDFMIINIILINVN